MQLIINKYNTLVKKLYLQKIEFLKQIKKDSSLRVDSVFIKENKTIAWQTLLICFNICQW